MSIQDAVARYNAVVEFTRKVMKSGKDYGVIPGTGDKPTLLKPGAEKLCSLFGLCPEFITTDKIVDFSTGLFYFEHRCDLYRNGVKIASGIGSCNSKEKKYRYRNVMEWKATDEEKAQAIRVETRQGQRGPYKVYTIENTEPFDLVNTISKMSQKRALIAATLVAANASEFYTQDIEDMDFIEGEYHESQPTQSAPAQPAQPQPKAANGFNPVAALVDAKVAENNHEAAAILNKYTPATVKGNQDALVAWGKLYRAWRDLGSEPEAAAKNATEGVPVE
jgi:hypothetical protein